MPEQVLHGADVVAVLELSPTPLIVINFNYRVRYRDGTTHVMFEPLDFIARLFCWAEVPLVQPGLLSPAGHGTGVVGLMARMGRKVALARQDCSLTRTELGKISWWWRRTWPLVTCG